MNCSVRIPELLNQLCNQSQGSNTTRRDACYGCFFRATSQTLGYSLLMAISNCADIYLNNTDYGHCQQYLRVSYTKFLSIKFFIDYLFLCLQQNATSIMNSRTSVTTIYCSFLECVRQVNKDTLVSRSYNFFCEIL